MTGLGLCAEQYVAHRGQQHRCIMERDFGEWLAKPPRCREKDSGPDDIIADPAQTSRSVGGRWCNRFRSSDSSRGNPDFRVQRPAMAEYVTAAARRSERQGRARERLDFLLHLLHQYAAASPRVGGEIQGSGPRCHWRANAGVCLRRTSTTCARR